MPNYGTDGEYTMYDYSELDLWMYPRIAVDVRFMGITLYTQ